MNSRCGCSKLSQVFWPVILMMAVSLAYADRDIVFSARFYQQTSDNKSGHFHIYRINSNGSRLTRLTCSTQDDVSPQWSPDGKRIVFVRTALDSEGVSQSAVLCIISPDGGQVCTLLELGRGGTWDLAWSPNSRKIAVGRTRWVWTADPPAENTESELKLIDAHTGRIRHFPDWSEFVWSPDCLAVAGHHDDRECILSLADKKTIHVQFPLIYPVWLDNSHIAGVSPIDGADKPFVSIRVLDKNGRLQRDVALKWAAPTNYPSQPGDWLRGIRTLTRIPGDKNGLVCGIDCGSYRSSLCYDFYRADLRSGEMKHLKRAQFLRWNGTGTEFCSAPVRILKALRNNLRVPISGLQVGKIGSPNVEQIVGGDVCVGGADWRNGDRASQQR